MARNLFPPIVVLLLLVSTSMGEPAKSRDCLSFVAINSHTFGSIVSSLQESFAQSGICFDIDRAPPLRNSLLLRQGKVDGELFRIPDYKNEIGDTAIMVPEPIIEGYGLLVATSQEVLDREPADIKGMAVGRGIVWQNHVSLPKSGVSEVGDYEALMTMLRTGRVSAALIDNINFALLGGPEEPFFAKRVTSKLQAHLFLHASRRSLLPEINAAIREWKEQHAPTQSAY